MSAPAGFEPFRARGVLAFVRPGDLAWMEELLEGHASLYEGARAAHDRLELQGRAPVYAVGSPLGRRVVRRYHRGGAVASLLGDLHLRLGPSRPGHEATASEAARQRGIPTPRVVAGAVYPAGLFYRADLVTEYVAGSTDLAAVLFGALPPAGLAPVEALRATGRLLARMGAAGVRHVDLNAKNVLLTPGDDMPQAHLLDMDRCRVTATPRSVDVSGMLARLERSLKKLEGSGGRPVPAEGREALRVAAHTVPRDPGSAEP